MFFPERVKNINDSDRILEIGPGATPHPRSTVFLELDYDSEQDRIAQSGHVGVLETEKKIVYYKGDTFPFEDNEFDYVICSHVLEHVENVPKFLSEIQRIASKGYLEFPTIYYDYLHNIEEHLNMLLYVDGEIRWCKKTETPIPGLTAFTNFFRTLQRKGFRFNKEINNLWHQGFEWKGEIKQRRVSDWTDLTYPLKDLEAMIEPPKVVGTHNYPLGVKQSFKHFLSQTKRKFSSRK